MVVLVFHRGVAMCIERYIFNELPSSIRGSCAGNIRDSVIVDVSKGIISDGPYPDGVGSFVYKGL